MASLEADLKALTDSMVARLCAARRIARRAAEEPVSLHDVASACATLSIDEPLAGEPIDLRKAGKRSRRLAARYHPDRHNGSEAMRDLYEAAIEAYAVLEAYNEQLSRAHQAAVNGCPTTNGEHQ